MTDSHGILAKNWSSADACTGKWQGITCKDGRVFFIMACSESFLASASPCFLFRRFHYGVFWKFPCICVRVFRRNSPSTYCILQCFCDKVLSLACPGLLWIFIWFTVDFSPISLATSRSHRYFSFLPFRNPRSQRYFSYLSFRTGFPSIWVFGISWFDGSWVGFGIWVYVFFIFCDEILMWVMGFGLWQDGLGDLRQV